MAVITTHSTADLDGVASTVAAVKRRSRSPNLIGTLKHRLPAPITRLLHEAGELADRMDLSAYVVGGFVRDLLLDLRNLDLDIVIEGDGIAFARALGRDRKARVKTHERFGTAVVIFPDGFKLDVAMARTESYEYPTALPTVEPSSIKQDLYRRDFTINTMAVRLNARNFGELIDFYGGRRDLKEKTLRVLHSLSFRDDPTRIFRAIRFEQRFGFHLSKETLALIKSAVKTDLLHRLSGHRLLAELIALLCEEEPRKAIIRMADLDVLRFIHPKLASSIRLQSLLRRVEDSWVVYMMALMHGLTDQAVADALARLSVPARDTKKIKVGQSTVPQLVQRLARRPPPRPSETYHLLAGLCDEALLILLATTKSESVKQQLSEYLTTYQHFKPSFDGGDLRAMGLKPGPIYKKILAHLLDARLNGEVKSARDELELVKQMAIL